MHISEGILSGPMLVSGAALAAAGTAIGLKKLDYDHIAKAGMLSAAFFVASLIHVPIGPSNAHLILNGLVGLLLGWAAFPAILVALVLQGAFFQFGGITTLGVKAQDDISIGIGAPQIGAGIQEVLHAGLVRGTDFRYSTPHIEHHGHVIACSVCKVFRQGVFYKCGLG